MRFRYAGRFAAGVALCAVHAFAQLTSIEGYIKNADGAPVATAVIRIIRTDVNRTFQTKTDKKGYYLYTSLPLGFYAVVVQVDGKEVAGVNGVKTQPGDPLLISFDLGATPEEQERKIKQALTKLAAEWSFIKIIPIQTSAPNPAARGGQAAAEPTRELTPEQKAAIEKQVAERAALLKQRDDLNNAFGAGMADLQARRYEEAVAALSKATEVDPKEAVPWANLGSAYAGLAGSKTGAEFEATMQKGLDAYARAIELKPNDAVTHNNYALALAKAKRIPEMQAELKKTADLDPANACHSYYNVGAVLTNTGQNDAALEAFKMAIAAAPDDPRNAEAYYQYGVALVSKAQIGAGGKVTPVAGTVEAFQKYLQLAPGGPNAQGTKEMLATLGSSIETPFTGPNAGKKKE
jgi:tetratricopeptide (TPR) repeat protein